MNRLLVAGLGGELATDDGIGPVVVRALEAAGGYPGVRLLDAGTGGYSLIAQLLDCERAILIDAARMGLEPGAVRGFPPEDLRARPGPAPLSGHQISLDSVLAAARQCGVAAEIYLIGIQPAELAHGYGLSPRLAALLPRILADVDALIGEHWTLSDTCVEA